MCGRFTLTTPPESLFEQFGLSGEIPGITPSYNVAPSREIPAVGADSEGERRLRLLRWGLVPHWAKDPEMGNRMINARAESVAEKPTFKAAFRRRRCLILADGFYEWRREGGSGPKQPYYIKMSDGSPYAFAGLWESWERDGEKIRSCAIITTEANELVADIHHRMPVILASEDYAAWLDADSGEDGLLSLLVPYPSEEMEAYPVSTHVNRPVNDDSGCVEPVGQAL